MATKSAKKKGMKPLAKMASTSKGPVHHVELHPAQNGKGKLAMRVLVHRQRPEAAQKSMDAGGPYVPEPQPEESIHEDPQDGIDHACSAFGMKNEPYDDDEDEGEPDGN